MDFITENQDDQEDTSNHFLISKNQNINSNIAFISKEERERKKVKRLKKIEKKQKIREENNILKKRHYLQIKKIKKEEEKSKEKKGKKTKKLKKNEKNKTENNEPIETEKEMELNEIKNYYLGLNKKEKKKEYRPKENSKDFFVFQWDNNEDTTKNNRPIYTAKKDVSLLFGRGNLGGVAPEEIKEKAKNYEKMVTNHNKNNA